MHDNEIKVDEPLVRILLQAQKPEWAGLPLTRLTSHGSDHALFKLEDDYVLRMPRIEWAFAGIEKEHRWVSELAQHLRFPISEPVYMGEATDEYPCRWLVVKWNQGHNPDYEIQDEYVELAIDLADFLNQLHAAPTSEGPLSRRGVPLLEMDKQTRESLAQLDDELDIEQIGQIWQSLSEIPEWSAEPVWLHGDFHQGNILVQENRLRAVIDFSDVGLGDPACDCIVAWTLFNSNSRQIFREHLQGIDEATWQRGRGWALSIALIMLPYYRDRNPYYATLARRVIKESTHHDK